MRWNATCELVRKGYAFDGEGVARPTDEPTEVFCNERTVGAATWQFYHEAGVSDVAEIEVRSDEYDGQRDVLYKGRWYSVEAVQARGDFAVLTLRHQQGDQADGKGEDGDERHGS